MKFGRIDLNCDVGEGAAGDAALLALVTSANIACGGHAGDLSSMRATVALAREHGVAVGAHPGYVDRAHFGRRELALTPDALERLITDQVEALREISLVNHVKPHGALYNLAARDRGVADAIARAVYAMDRELILFALAGSELVKAGEALGLRVAQEVFADRAYLPSGALVPRSRGDALIEQKSAMVEQALRMVREGVVRTVDGTEIPVVVDTICLHGDGAQAVELAGRLRRELAAAGVKVQALSR